MLLVDGKPHHFTRLPLDLPSRGLPMAMPRERPNVAVPHTILEIWKKAEAKVYEAVCILRSARHVVWRVSNHTAQIDGKQISTKELIALSRAKQGAEKWPKS